MCGQGGESRLERGVVTVERAEHGNIPSDVQRRRE
jgi:hypothetical protein